MTLKRARDNMIKRMLRTDAEDDDIQWITVKGTHIPLKDGEAIGGPFKGQRFGDESNDNANSKLSSHNLSGDQAQKCMSKILAWNKKKRISKNGLSAAITDATSKYSDNPERRELAAAIEFLKKNRNMTEAQIAKATGIPEDIVTYYNKALAVEGQRETYVKLKSHPMSIEELRELPIVREAQEDCKKARKEGTHKIHTAKRERIRAEVAQTILDRGSKDENGGYTGEVKKNKRVDIVIGPIAAGKSSVLVDRISKGQGSRILDTDDIKDLLPGNEGAGGAARVNSESRDILSKRILPKLLDEHSEYYKDNLVIPCSGIDEKKPLSYLQMFGDAGYEVHLSLNTLPVEKCANRMLTRYIEDGRYVDFDYVVDELADAPDGTYDLLKDMKCFASYTKINNDVNYGEEPILVECEDGEGNDREPEAYLPKRRKR